MPTTPESYTTDQQRRLAELVSGPDLDNEFTDPGGGGGFTVEGLEALLAQEAAMKDNFSLDNQAEQLGNLPLASIPIDQQEILGANPDISMEQDPFPVPEQALVNPRVPTSKPPVPGTPSVVPPTGGPNPVVEGPIVPGPQQGPPQASLGTSAIDPRTGHRTNDPSARQFSSTAESFHGGMGDFFSMIADALGLNDPTGGGTNRPTNLSPADVVGNEPDAVPQPPAQAVSTAPNPEVSPVVPQPDIAVPPTQVPNANPDSLPIGVTRQPQLSGSSRRLDGESVQDPDRIQELLAWFQQLLQRRHPSAINEVGD